MKQYLYSIVIMLLLNSPIFAAQDVTRIPTPSTPYNPAHVTETTLASEDDKKAVSEAEKQFYSPERHVYRRPGANEEGLVSRR